MNVYEFGPLRFGSGPFPCVFLCDLDCTTRWEKRAGGKEGGEGFWRVSGSGKFEPDFSG